MRVLIVYGSKMGGTAGIASTMAEAFAGHGVQTDVLRAEDAGSPQGYDAAIIGSGLYAGRWRRAAARFVRQHAETLRGIPTWFFSSGPLDDSAVVAIPSPTRQVSKLMALVAARGHTTFGGRLLSTARGFPASAMAKTRAGDWRNTDQINAWAWQIAEELRVMVPVPAPAR